MNKSSLYESTEIGIFIKQFMSRNVTGRNITYYVYSNQPMPMNISVRIDSDVMNKFCRTYMSCLKIKHEHSTLYWYCFNRQNMCRTTLYEIVPKRNEKHSLSTSPLSSRLLPLEDSCQYTQTWVCRQAFAWFPYQHVLYDYFGLFSILIHFWDETKEQMVSWNSVGIKLAAETFVMLQRVSFRIDHWFIEGQCC